MNQPKLSELQLKLLENLREACVGSEDYLYYPYASITDGIDVDRKELTKAMRRLRKLELAQFARGLMTEEGQVAGSGFRITDSGEELLDQLIQELAMVLADFDVEVSRNEKIHSVQVIVYDTNEALNHAVKTYDAASGSSERVEENVRAITHSFQIISLRPDRPDSIGKRVAIIRVDKTAGASILAHEIFHAACQVYRTVFAERIVLGDECNDNEEKLAYLLSDLMYAITTKLISKGVW